jgi:hypothetical protein
MLSIGDHPPTLTLPDRLILPYSCLHAMQLCDCELHLVHVVIDTEKLVFE